MKLRSVALPPEHGSWNLALEPVLLGLLLAPSVPGVAAFIGVAAAFLLRRPLQVAVTSTFTLRRRAAVSIAIGYGLVGAAAWSWVVLAAGPRPLLTIAVAIPLAAGTLAAATRGRSRSAAADVAAATAFGVLGSAPLLAAGATLEVAALVAAIALLRSVPAVAYVRARVARERGRPSRVHKMGVVVAHAAAVVAVLAVASALLAGSYPPGIAVPWSAAIPYAALLGRAVLGLAARRWPRSIRAVGVLETLLGVAWLATLVAVVEAI